MKHIITITDKDITGSDKLSNSKPRIAVNAVLFDKESNIALSYLGKYGLYTLPGGGLEAGEDFFTAVKREVWKKQGAVVRLYVNWERFSKTMGKTILLNKDVIISHV